MKIIVVGCGRLGSGLAQYLSQNGHTVTVIDKDPAAFERLPSFFKGEKVTGVGFDRDVLLQSGIERTDAVIAVTSSDEKNAVIARVANRFFHVPKVVARLYDQRKAEIYKRLGLQAVDPTRWAIDRLAELVCYSPLGTVFSMGNGGVEIVQMEVPSLLVGRKVTELTIPGEIQVISISRGSKTFLPTLGTEFKKRDLACIAVASASGQRLKTILGLV